AVSMTWDPSASRPQPSCHKHNTQGPIDQLGRVLSSHIGIEACQAEDRAVLDDALANGSRVSLRFAMVARDDACE
ncbi:MULTISPECIES: hypothetical protein, partial [unclassified Mesorhizobium]|uniref:hypothetical protein n=1 Tax=unclassified Mesorhizobium TaxID=325217 RepID=UPI0030152BAA